MLLITCVRDCQCASFILSDDKQPASKILARTPLLLGLSMRHRLFCCQGARSQLVLAQTFHTYYHLRWQTLSTVHNIWCTSYHKQLRICTSCTNIWSSSTSCWLEVVFPPTLAMTNSFLYWLRDSSAQIMREISKITVARNHFCWKKFLWIDLSIASYQQCFSKT